MKKYIYLLLCVFVALSGSASAEIIPASRRITWQGNVGVLGDIPARTTIYATLDPSGADDTSAIQTAIDGCPADQVVKLNPGIFNISNSLNFGKNGYGKVLRGSGMGVTIIKGSATFAGNLLVDVLPTNIWGGNYSWDLSYPSPKTLTSSGLTKGSTTVTTSVEHGYTQTDINLGLYVQIDQLWDDTAFPPISPIGSGGACGSSCGRGCSSTDETNCRPFGQIVRVTGIPTSTTLTLEIPLYYDYDISKSPQIAFMGKGPDGGQVNGTVVVGFGIEDLTLDNTLSKKNDIISLTHTVNSWIFRVEMIGQNRDYINMWRTYRNTIRECKMHGMNTVNQPGVGYSILISPGGSANLFENNIMYEAFAMLVSNGTTSGNVFAYNYYGKPQKGFMVPGSIYFHGAHNMMNLFEGNVFETKVASDYVWGTSSHNTFFRNQIKNLPAEDGYGANDNFAVELMKGQQYFNFIGNVIGSVGRESLYEMLYDTNWNLQNVTVYTLGHNSTGVATPGDASVATTLYRHGNWDSVNNYVLWDESNADHSIPDSLYLSSKPAFFGSCAWPSVGSDLSPMVGTLPAKQRYEAGIVKNHGSPKSMMSRPPS
jgi:hypothetical protein